MYNTTRTVSFGIFVSFSLLVAQFIELKNLKKFEKNVKNLNECNESQLKIIEINIEKNENSFLKKLIFDKNVYHGFDLIHQIIQIILIILMFIFVSAHTSIKNRYMLTYLTKGPGKLSVSDYTNVFSIYWSLFVISRLITTFFAFKLNPIIFLFCVHSLNMLMCFLFVVPYFLRNKLFFWINISLIGFISGPMQPSSFMLAKYILGPYSSLVMSFFLFGLNFGSIFSGKVVGSLLDVLSFQLDKPFLGFEKFQPASIIAHALFGTSFLAVLIFLLISFFFKKYKSFINK